MWDVEDVLNNNEISNPFKKNNSDSNFSLPSIGCLAGNNNEQLDFSITLDKNMFTFKQRRDYAKKYSESR